MTGGTPSTGWIVIRPVSPETWTGLFPPDNPIHDTYIYLLHEAVEAVFHPPLSQLSLRGLHIHACAQAARERHLELPDWVHPAGLGTLRDIMVHVTSLQTIDHAPASRPPTDPGLPCLRLDVVASGSNPALTREAIRVAAGLAAAGTPPVHLHGDPIGKQGKQWGWVEEELLAVARHNGVVLDNTPPPPDVRTLWF
jgi:hypothetical protein